MQGLKNLKHSSILTSPDLNDLFFRIEERLGKSFVYSANKPSKGSRVAKFGMD